MERNYKDLLIELFVPLVDGNGEGRIGTGFPIARNRILTARHVLCGDGVDQESAFELRWHHRREEPVGQWRTVAREQIVFAGTEDLDAAVIDYEFPSEVAAWFLLTARNHATGTRWESEGFAAVGARDDDTREAIPLQGKTYRYASRARDAWLDVDAPTAPSGWKGASGSPVIVFSQVAGILTEVPPGFAGARLKALPAARLLGDEQFRNAIGYRADGNRIAALEAVLDRERRRHPRAIGTLECAIDDTAGALFRDPNRSVEGLARALSDANVSDLLHFARRAVVALRPQHPEDAHAVGELVQQLLPLLYDHTAVDSVRVRVAEPAAVLVGLPVATAFVAETVMAGADGRETRWRPPQPTQELEGRLRLPNTPNNGIDATGERARESFEEHLRRKLAVNTLTDFEAAFCRCLSEFVPAELRTRLGNNAQVLQSMAAAKVADLAATGQRHYYLFQLPKADEERATVLTTVQYLKDSFPAVAFLELADDGELMAAEWTDFLPLQDILTAMEH